jgi:hypothetical protein
VKKIAKTKEILSSYRKGGINSVVKYISDPDIEFKEDTWAFKVKKLLDSNYIKSLEQEIILILYKFDLNERDERGEDTELYAEKS